MYVLDTDCLSLYFRERSKYPALELRIKSTPAQHRFICIVTVEELLRGALALIREHQRSDRVVIAYDLMLQLITDLQEFAILPYDQEAEAIFKNHLMHLKRIGTQDCRIAACALSRGYTVVTRNLRDFSQVAGLNIEDWTG